MDQASQGKAQATQAISQQEEQLSALNDQVKQKKLDFTKNNVDLRNQTEFFKEMPIETDEDIERGLDADLLEEYLQSEIDNGSMTEEHVQNLRDYAEKAVEHNPHVWIQLVGRHEYYKEVKPYILIIN